MACLLKHLGASHHAKKGELHVCTHLMPDEDPTNYRIIMPIGAAQQRGLVVCQPDLFGTAYDQVRMSLLRM